MNINTMPVIAALAIISAIALTVLAHIFILPESKRAKLPKIGQIAADIFTFKTLFIEKILRGLYIFLTVLCVCYGVLSIFGFSVYDGYYGGYFQWYGGYGLLLLIVGPIVLRLAFEGCMMFILLVKNTIEINNKLKNQNVQEPTPVEAPAPAEIYAPVEEPVAAQPYNE